MFEIEQMEQKFDYSLVDNETAEFLRSCEYEMNGIAEDARVKFGGVLIKAQDKLAKKGYGVFKEWVVSGGISIDDAYYYINLNRTSRNLDERKQDNFLKAPKSLQKEVMKKNAPEELKEKVFDGDITTNKQYKEMMKKLEQAEQAKQQAERQAQKARESEQIAIRRLEEMEDREPEIIEKEVVKEVIPDHVKKQIEEKEVALRSSKQELESMKEEIKRLRYKTGNGDEEAKKEKEVKLLMLDASKSVLNTKIKIDEFLQEVAVTPYRRGAIAASSEGAKNKLIEGVEELKNFIKEMELAIDGTIEH